jgi:hypothetical protein
MAIPHVDNVGHIGGLLAGLLLGIVFGKHLDDSRESRRYRRTAWLSLIFLYLVVLGYASFTWNGVSIQFQKQKAPARSTLNLDRPKNNK